MDPTPLGNLGVPEGPYRDTRRRRRLSLSPHRRYPEAFAYHLRRASPSRSVAVGWLVACIFQRIGIVKAYRRRAGCQPAFSCKLRIASRVAVAPLV